MADFETYVDPILSKYGKLESPEKDLDYWRSKLGINHAATPGFYFDDEGVYRKIFGGEDTYKLDFDPRASATDFDYSFKNLKKSKEAKEKDLSLMGEVNEAISKLQKEAAAKGIKVEDADVKPYENDFPFYPSDDLLDAMGPTRHYWMSYNPEKDFHYYPEEPGAWPGGVTVSVPTHPNIFNWGVNVEEITGHGDMQKLTNDPALPHALWANMYDPGYFKDNYLPEYNWERKMKDQRGYVPPKNKTIMETIFPDASFPAYKQSNYIANQEMNDLQGLGDTGFNIKNEYDWSEPKTILEEMYSKDLVEEDVPLHSWAEDLYDNSRMSYSRGLFNQLKEMTNDYNKYLAMTGPLRDRSTPIWASEVKNPLFQFKYNAGIHDDIEKDEYDVIPESAVSGRYAPWNKTDWVMNPFPEYSRFGGPDKFWNEFLKPMSHEGWWSGDKAGSKFQSLDDQKQAELGNIVSHVTDANKHQMLPYFKDYFKFSDYAPVPIRGAGTMSDKWKSDTIWDYLKDPKIDEHIAKLNKAK